MKNTKQVMLRIPPELYDRLSSTADAMMTTPSALARILVKMQLDYWDQEAGLIEEHGGNVENATLPTISRQARRQKQKQASKKRKKQK